MRTRPVATLIAAAAMAILAMPAQALAASTTVTTAGHSFTLGSSTVNIDVPSVGIGGQCTMSGGTGTVPAAPGNHNASGPVTINLTTKPKFTSCSSGYLGFPPYLMGMTAEAVIETSWSVTLQSGSPATATVNIPESGLRTAYIGGAGTCTGINSVPASLGGNWTNGTTSPLVASTMAIAGSYKTRWSGSNCTWLESVNPTQVSGATVSVTDTTNGSQVIKVGT